MFDFMSPLPLYLATISDETLSILFVGIGVLALIIARMFGPAESITRRAYGKRYSGAPGADTESKPDAG